MKRFSTYLAIFLLAGLWLITGCSDKVSSEMNDVLHLDPRMPDGKSSARVLSETCTIINRQRFDASGEQQGNWKITGAVLSEAPGTDGVVVKRRIRHSGKEDAVRFHYTKPLRANRISAIELDMLIPELRGLRMEWRRKTTLGSTNPALLMEVHGEPKVRTVRIYLDSEPNWFGEIESFWIAPEWNSDLVFHIQEIRLVSVGFNYGSEPLEGDRGDGGLFESNRQAYRVWPSDLGMSLFATLTLPDKAFFESTVIVLPGLDRRSADFSLSLKEPDGQWVALHHATVRTRDGWTPFSTDLSTHAGKKVKLRLTTSGEDKRQDKNTQRASCLWGEPKILHPASAPIKPSVILFTLDTTRADHIGDGEKTPFIARVGREGIFFDNAWCNCNSTTPSHASILTGKYIYEHGAHHNRTKLAMKNVTLAERFREAGYHTAAAVSVNHIQAGAGFGQGFDRFRLADGRTSFDGRNTVNAAIAYLKEWRKQGNRPFFLWVHLFDPHIPYGPPGSFTSDYVEKLGIVVPDKQNDPPSFPIFDAGTPESLAWISNITSKDHVSFLYEAGVGYVDSLVGEVLKTGEDLNLLDHTAVVITADHGEALGEHEVWFDHAGLFTETLNVPLILKVPDGPEGLRIDDIVSTLDIAPTLLSLCGLEPIPGLHGKDLVTTATGGGDSARRVWFEYNNLFQVGTRDNRHHFVTTLKKGFNMGLRMEINDEGKRIPKYNRFPQGTAFLYDVRKDPNLEKEISKDHPKLVEAYNNLVGEWYRTLSEGGVTERKLSDEEEARLRALGYGAGK